MAGTRPLQFSANFWGEEGYVVIEQFLNERNTSAIALQKFMTELSKHEEQYALGLEKLVKKVGVNVQELGSVDETWQCIMKQMEQHVKIVTERSLKLNADVCVTLDVFEKENARIVKKSLNEVKKLLGEQQQLQSALSKARGKYNKACVLAQEMDKVLQNAKNGEKTSKSVYQLEKEYSKAKKMAKSAEASYKDTIEKIVNYQPHWIKKMQTLYTELQAQELCRLDVVFRCFRTYTELHSPVKVYIENLQNDIFKYLNNAKFEKDMDAWIEKHKTSTEPPPLPVFHPFDGEPSKPAAPKPEIKTHRTSVSSSSKSEAPSAPLALGFARASKGKRDVVISPVSSPQSSQEFVPRGSDWKRRVGGRSSSVHNGGSAVKSPSVETLKTSTDTNSPRVENNNPTSLALSAKKHSSRTVLQPLSTRSAGKDSNRGKPDVEVSTEIKATLGNSHSRGTLPDIPSSDLSTPIPIPTTVSPLASPPTSPAPNFTIKNSRIKGRFSPKNDMLDTFQALGVNRKDLDNLNDNQFFSTLSDSLDIEVKSPLSLSSAQIENVPEKDIEDLEEEIEEFEPIGWVRAIYDYEASDEDELQFQEGDIIKLLAQHESGWWTGELNGITGLFPANHVEITYEVP